MSVSRRSLFVFVFSGLLAACGGEAVDDGPAGGPVPDRPTEIGVTVDHDGGSTALRVGHVLRVELPAQPDEGAFWEVASVDDTVLRVPVEEYAPPDVEGEPGTSVWRFEALGPGTATLRMRYMSVAEDEPTEERTFVFRVVVD